MFRRSSLALRSWLTGKPASSQIPYLPLELVEMVIDHLHDDGESLAACALVSRAWLPSTRIHILQSLSLSKTTDYARLAELIDSAPELAGYVRAVTIYGDLPFSLGVDSYEWLKEAFAVLSRLPNVYKLRLWAFDWGAAHRFLQINADVFSRVETLCADGVRFSSVEDILLFTKIFSQVTSLTLRDVHIAGLDLSSIPSVLSNSTPLQRLCLFSNGAEGPLIDLLLLPHFNFDLRSLKTSWTPQLCTSSHFQTLARSAGNTVEDLAIAVKCTPSEELVSSLESFNQLKRLTFSLEDSNGDNAETWLWMSSTLSKIPSSIQEIVLEFHPYPQSTSIPKDDQQIAQLCQQIDQDLSNKSRFPALRHFIVQASADGPSDIHSVDQEIQKLFPIATTRGLTRVGSIRTTGSL